MNPYKLCGKFVLHTNRENVYIEYAHTIDT